MSNIIILKKCINCARIVLKKCGNSIILRTKAENRNFKAIDLFVLKGGTHVFQEESL